VVTFLIDFTIRIFINPRYAPTLILGQWVVHKQQAEYVGAPQKRFAWVIGFVLALTMLYLVVINNVIGPINLIVCSICLTLLFCESAFGICIGCKIYNLFSKEKAQLCPGGVCELPAGQGFVMSLPQIIILIIFTGLVIAITQWVYRTGTAKLAQVPQASAPVTTVTIDPAEAERCKVPDYAKALGHEEKWKLHNNCK
jgi:hypothetical protein